MHRVPFALLVATFEGGPTLVVKASALLVAWLVMSASTLVFVRAFLERRALAPARTGVSGTVEVLVAIVGERRLEHFAILGVVPGSLAAPADGGCRIDLVEVLLRSRRCSEQFLGVGDVRAEATHSSDVERYAGSSDVGRLGVDYVLQARPFEVFGSPRIVQNEEVVQLGACVLVEVVSGKTDEIVVENGDAITPAFEGFETAGHPREVCESALKVVRRERNPLSIIWDDLASKGPEKIGAEGDDTTVGVGCVGVRVHGDDGGEDVPERVDESLLQDGLMQGLLLKAGGGGRRMEGRGVALCVVQDERPASLAVLVRPEMGAELIDEGQPGRLWIPREIAPIEKGSFGVRFSTHFWMWSTDCRVCRGAVDRVLRRR